jgi:YwhD family
MDENKVKKPLALNIVSSKVEHKGFGAGSIDLNNVSSVIIDGDECYIDEGALHAKSKVEMRIRFSSDKSLVPNGRTVWLVWVAVDRNEEGQFYGGVTACEMLIDKEEKKGWKLLVDHVNRMDAAMKRRMMVENLGDKEKVQLREFLMNHNIDMWNRSSDELKEALA